MPGIKLDFPVIMGLDVAGEIVEVGPGVQGWKAGDRVLVDPINRAEGGLMGETVHGGLAELCKAREHQLIRIPDGVSYEQAAALPVAFGTAYRMMNTIGQVQAGEKVLVLGASGGVGVGCVMLAKIAGAQVIACASSEAKMQRLRELGADHVINYADTDFAKAIYELYGKPHRRKFDGGVDVAVNFTGGDTWVKSMRCLRRRPPADLRRDRRLRSADRPALHLDLRTEHPRLQRLDARRPGRPARPGAVGQDAGADRPRAEPAGCRRGAAPDRGPRSHGQGRGHALTLERRAARRPPPARPAPGQELLQ